ncbi:hypothetical protein G6F61_007980 [Rhizopus arrhizus]|nr:hypothetical protein G6F32_008270 [Rhizopus arrhizus]KAG1375999.1 hypothetical protein G6F61_007980 [Rhizopus arrhizus]
MALDRLKVLEKRHRQIRSFNKPKGFFQDLLLIWKQTTDVTTPNEDVLKEYQEATLLLKESAATFENNDALLLLAELNLFSKYAHPRNYQQAFMYYNELASKGNSTAQYMLGFMYASGLGVEKDQAKASIYYTFAAHGGDTMAEMTLGYRHLYGIHAEESCEDALYYYRNVAEKAVRYYHSGPPNGRTLPLSKVRLSDEHGGVYGYGASMTVDKKSHLRSEANIRELLQYWKYLGESEGDRDAQVKMRHQKEGVLTGIQLRLGQVYYSGTRDIKKDHKEAIRYFSQIVEKGLATPRDKLKKKEIKQIGQAAGYLGLMYWRGEGVRADPQAAYQWFLEGYAFDDPISQNALGLMYKNGIVVEENQRAALHHFKLAADQEYAEAEINLALEYVQDDLTLPVAIEKLNKAAESKHLLAYWYLGQLNDQGYIPTRSCRVSVHYYKAISEAGDWLYPTVEQAYSAYKHGDEESALLYYRMAAERGYEIAQSNVAYLLDPDKRLWDFMPLLTKEKKVRDEDAEKNAFLYWSRSAHQNNVDARVKMCDYYYKGIGTKVNYEKAAACYRNAAEDYRSPLAYWNLGWMYENGVGVQKDLPLAKKAYDLALEYDADAYLPIKLSLLSWWKNWWLLGLKGDAEL